MDFSSISITFKFEIYFENKLTLIQDAPISNKIILNNCNSAENS